MLAKVAPPANDFQALARYLVRGKSGAPDPTRVAWVFTKNLPTDDPLLAATYMEATAQLSARTRKAAYHLMVAWHERERPTPELMQEVARQTLQLAGLGEHQALVMGHSDKPHPHLHILLNRVHPVTGRAWKTSHDFAAFDRIMRQLSSGYGFEYAPAHIFNPDATESLPKKPNSRATYAAKRGGPTRRLQWSRQDAQALGESLSEDLTRSSTPDDVLQMLANRGLALEAKGRGHVIGNAQGYVKLSNVPLEATAHGLGLLREAIAARTQPQRSRRRVFDVDGVDVTRAFMAMGLTDRDDLAAAIEDARRERQVRRRRADASTMLMPIIPAGPHSRRRGRIRFRAGDPKER